MSMSIFISHATADLELVQAIVKLIHGAFDLATVDVVATSLDGYGLPLGATIDESILEKLREADVFLAVITPISYQSLYVLFETGARWGMEKHLIPIIAMGIRATDIQGPLARLNLCDASIPYHIKDLVEKLGTLLKIEAKPGLDREIERLVFLSRRTFPSAATIRDACQGL